MISIKEMEDMLDTLANELPQEFYQELNGGIMLLPEAKMSEHSRADDLYILGEYHRDTAMGRYIAIYYGSFIKVFGNLEGERMKEKLRKTLRHEFRHHLESMAGEKGLEIEDEKYLENYLKRFDLGKNKNN